MMKNALLLLVIVLMPAYIAGASANEKVKYCKNYQTGQIIVVDKYMPCPYPTVEI